MVGDYRVIRMRIHNAGSEFFESLSDMPTLKNIAGEFMALNEDWCLIHPDTIGYDEIMSTGFTTNQKRWLVQERDHHCPKHTYHRVNNGNPDAIMHFCAGDRI